MSRARPLSPAARTANYRDQEPLRASLTPRQDRRRRQKEPRYTAWLKTRNRARKAAV